MLAWIIATVLAVGVVVVGTYYASEVMEWENRNPYTTQIAYTHSLAAMLSVAAWGIGVGLFIWISPLEVSSLWKGSFPLMLLVFLPTIFVVPIVHGMRYSTKRKAMHKK